MIRFKNGSCIIIAFVLTASLISNAQKVNHINSQDFLYQYEYLLTSDRVKIIDGRTNSMFYSQHIAGAINIDADLCDAEQLLRQETTTPVVVIYCTTNRRNNDLLEILSSFYSSEIYLISDGIKGWINNKFPVMCGTIPECKND